jgi:hypothetical protein
MLYIYEYIHIYTNTYMCIYTFSLTEDLQTFIFSLRFNDTNIDDNK